MYLWALIALGPSQMVEKNEINFKRKKKNLISCDVKTNDFTDLLVLSKQIIRFRWFVFFPLFSIHRLLSAKKSVSNDSKFECTSSLYTHITFISKSQNYLSIWWWVIKNSNELNILYMRPTFCSVTWCMSNTRLSRI